ncbi:MAG: hypothetical protein WDN25_01325 [Acetobacteraceae bacterium]
MTYTNRPTVLAPAAAAMSAPHMADRPSCALRLASPPDPLTRMLMEADGVTESELDVLVQQVARSLAGRSARRPLLRTQSRPGPGAIVP